MDCGIPYCHNGCPVNNQIPDWNDLVYREQWKAAALNLHSTNNFPEVTGRVCPAPCEASCTLNIDDKPVTIKTIECAIADKAFAEGWIAPQPPEREDRQEGRHRRLGAGGARRRPAAGARRPRGARLREERQARRAAASTASPTSRWRSTSSSGASSRWRRRASSSTAACTSARTCRRPGARGQARRACCSPAAPSSRSISSPSRRGAISTAPLRHGLPAAAEPARRRRAAGQGRAEITAKGKHVIVIGGGDTGSDCIGTSFRQGAKSVTQLEIMPMPPEKENKALSWPHWPLKLRVSSSQAEGAKVEYSISTTGFAGENGKVEKLLYTRVDSAPEADPGQRGRAAGRPRAVRHGLLGAGRGRRGRRSWSCRWCRAAASRASTPTSATTASRRREKVFAAGDIRRGQIAGGVGDPRGPAGGARHRPLPDGPQRPAALRAVKLHTRHVWTAPGWQGVSCCDDLGLGSGHVYGLLMRPLHGPLALMKFATPACRWPAKCSSCSPRC